MRPYIAVALTLLLGPVAASQALAQSTKTEALGQVKTGDRLKVAVPGATWVGTYQRFEGGEILLARDSLIERLALDQVTGLWVRGRSTKAGAIVGAIVGAGFGGFLGLIVAAVCEYDCPSQASGVVVGGLAGGLGGLGFGAIVGAAIPRWKRIFR